MNAYEVKSIRRSSWRLPILTEVVGAFLWCEGVERVSDATHRAVTVVSAAALSRVLSVAQASSMGSGGGASTAAVREESAAFADQVTHLIPPPLEEPTDRRFGDGHAPLGLERASPARVGSFSASFSSSSQAACSSSGDRLRPPQADPADLGLRATQRAAEATLT